MIIYSASWRKVTQVFVRVVVIVIRGGGGIRRAAVDPPMICYRWDARALNVLLVDGHVG
jgi:prepilin-type processing-associated H-X9-DG protein